MNIKEMKEISEKKESFNNSYAHDNETLKNILMKMINILEGYKKSILYILDNIYLKYYKIRKLIMMSKIIQIIKLRIIVDVIYSQKIKMKIMKMKMIIIFQIILIQP